MQLSRLLLSLRDCQARILYTLHHVFAADQQLCGPHTACYGQYARLALCVQYDINTNKVHFRWQVKAAISSDRTSFNTAESSLKVGNFMIE